MPNPRSHGTGLCFDMPETERLISFPASHGVLEDWGVLAFPAQGRNCGPQRWLAAFGATGWLFSCLYPVPVQLFSPRLFACVKLLTRVSQIMPKCLQTVMPLGGRVQAIIAYFKRNLNVRQVSG